jgi:hypothetical protein
MHIRHHELHDGYRANLAICRNGVRTVRDLLDHLSDQHTKLRR